MEPSKDLDNNDPKKIIILDDCLEPKKCLENDEIKKIIFNGRHHNLQYFMPSYQSYIIPSYEIYKEAGSTIETFNLNLN